MDVNYFVAGPRNLQAWKYGRQRGDAMLKRALFIGLLMLPGSFVVLGLACGHPRLRREILQLSGLSRPLERVSRAYVAVRWRSRA